MVKRASAKTPAKTKRTSRAGTSTTANSAAGKPVRKKAAKPRAAKKKVATKPTAKKPPRKKPATKKRTAAKRRPSSAKTKSPQRQPASRPQPVQTDPAAAAAYQAKKVAENNKQRDASSDRREIGAIPGPLNPQRRASCEQDFDLFLRTYFPADTKHPWSDVHLKLIDTIQIVVLVGALLAVGIPRGWGKTFICVRAVLWAIAFRHHTMVMLIAASDAAAADLIQDIRDELETNDLLRQDFPELCLPIAALEGINQRAKGQTSGGVPTKVKAKDHELHLGDVQGRPGAVIYAGGITGSKIRGRRKKRGDQIQRPTLGLVDDFQTRQSARSKLQCETRLNIVQDDVPGLPGNDQAWSCLLTCTVIESGDAADQLLDRTKHPDWRGIRQAFLESLPDDDALDHWQEWNRIREDALQTFDQKSEDIEQEAIAEVAHAYYRKHFKAMNAGASVAWQYAYKPEHYVDALEKAMHWYFRSRRGFWSELQNQPDKFEESAVPQLNVALLITRTHHLKRHLAPIGAEYITAHSDVAKPVLWYEIRAWAQDSTSWTIDYGTWPEQKRSYFTQATAKNTIDKMYAHLPTWELRCIAAIRDLFVPLFDRQFQREDGAVLRLNLAGIDGNDETETVKEGIRKSGLQGKLWPMHSRSFRAKTPLNELPKKDGDVLGDNWRRRNPQTGNMRYITFDTDRWKSQHRDRLMMPALSPGSLTWFAGREHRMLADHHCAEYSQNVYYEKTDSTLEQWSQQPNQDNHLWDVGVGNDVLGSVLGLKLPANQLLNVAAPAKKKKRRRTKIVI